MNDKFLVYCHIRPDTNEVFYIGKGTQKRMRDRSNRSRYWHNIVNKAGGYITKIVAANLFEREALSFEKLLIAKLRNAGASICNLTDGGDGISGYRHTEETRRKFSERMKGKPSPTLGKKFTAEHREKLRLAKLGKKQTEEHRLRSAQARIGHAVSEETRRKLSATNTGYKHTECAKAKMRRKVFCITTNTLYESVTGAAAALGLHHNNISKVCLGKLNKTGGYQFSYA